MLSDRPFCCVCAGTVVLKWTKPVPDSLSESSPKRATPTGALIFERMGVFGQDRVGLLAHLEARILTPGQMQGLLEFATKISQGLGLADAKFETRQRMIEELNVQAILTVEDGQKVAYVSCIIHPEEERLVCELRPVAEEGGKSK